MKWPSLSKKRPKRWRCLINLPQSWPERRRIGFMKGMKRIGRRSMLPKDWGKRCSSRLKKLRPIYLLWMTSSYKQPQGLQFFRITNWQLNLSINPNRRSYLSTKTTRWKLRLKHWNEILTSIKKLRRNLPKGPISVKKWSKDSNSISKTYKATEKIKWTWTKHLLVRWNMTRIALIWTIARRKRPIEGIDLVMTWLASWRTNLNSMRKTSSRSRTNMSS